MYPPVSGIKIRELLLASVIRTSGTFLIIGSASGTKITQTDNFVNVNVFNSVACPCVLSYRCVLHYFLTMPVGFNFNITFGLKPQGSGIKIVTV